MPILSDGIDTASVDERLHAVEVILDPRSENDDRTLAAEVV
jgi:hypothetical protein